ncbi:hypothetical protein GCM10028805_21510 [Spirosoma harenae]
MIVKQLNKILKISLISVILLQISCAPQPALTAELVPRSLRAVNLEETVSRRDELMMAYSLTSYDTQNKPVAVVNGGWGVVTVQKDQLINLQATGNEQISTAKPINLELPRNGRIVASLVLIEVDDYTRAKETMAKIQKIHNIVAIPIGILLTVTEALTPLKYVSAGLVASGVGLQLLDKLDDDDLLGQSSVELKEADFRKSKQKLVHVPTIFTGKNMNDAFDYRLEYDVLLKTVKIQPVRQ